MESEPRDDPLPPHAVRPLEGIRVVEAGGFVSAAYATKILADLGAEVIKIEPPGGDRTRRAGPFVPGRDAPDAAGLFTYLNAGKSAAVLDLGDPAALAHVRGLVRDADVFIHNLSAPEVEAAGLRYEDLHDATRLLYTWITPFGRGGPHSDWEAEDLTVLAAGGWLYLSPGGGSDPSRPPLRPYGHCASFQAGVHAAMVTLAALHERDRSGRGQAIEISAQECIAAALEGALVRFLYIGEVASRMGRWSYAPRCVVRASDGMLFINILEDDQWRRFVALMGSPDWAQADAFAERTGRVEHYEVLNALIAEWARDQRVSEFFQRAGEAGLPCSPVFDVDDIVNSPHLAARDFFRPVSGADGHPVLAPASPLALSGLGGVSAPAPAHRKDARPRFRATADETAEGLHTVEIARSANPEPPLSGIRILDLSWVWAGPYCTLNLAHLGAEVIRVESTRRIDIQRRLPPFAGGVPGVNRAGLSNQWNLGKRSVTVDFTSAEGRELVLELARVCDAVVENFSVGTLDRYGLGWRDLSRANPGLVMLSLSAFGASGPYAPYVAYGSTQVMMSGLAMRSGWPGDPPTDVGLSYGDPNAGLHGAVAVLAALRARDRDGRGRRIDLSQWEALLAVLPEGLLHQTMTGAPPARLGNGHPQMAPHGVYPCAGEDRWLSIAVRDDGEWARLAGLVGVADARFDTLHGRLQHAAALDERLGEWTRTRSAWSCATELQRLGIPAFPVMDTRDLASDEHLAARGFFVRLPHAEAEGLRHAGVPWRFSRSLVGPFSHAPLLGADTDWALTGLLGKAPEDVERLAAAGVLE